MAIKDSKRVQYVNKSSLFILAGIILFIMTNRKHSSSEYQSHTTHQMKSTSEFQQLILEDLTIGDMVDVNEKQQKISTSKPIKRKVIRRGIVQKKWSQLEISRLHKCVEIFGIDFTLIGKMFANRTRYELMNKFKKEDKVNSIRVNQALNANKRMRLSKYVKRQKSLRKESLISVNSLDSNDVDIVNEVRRMITEQEGGEQLV